MRPAEAEKLLGGYATGTLTEAERQHLFAAALEHQALFDALMDEEVLRELLADRAVKAQLILALAHSAAPNVVPFWRRTGVLGAAAGLLVATTAGLAILRSPRPQAPPALEAAKAAAMKADAAGTPGAPESKASEPKAVPAQASAAPAPAPAALAAGLQAEAPPPPPAPKADLMAREEAAPRLAKAEPPKVAPVPPARLADGPAAPAPAPAPAAAAVVEVVQANAAKGEAAKEELMERKLQATAQPAPPSSAPAAAAAGIVGGVMGGAAAPAQAQAKKAGARSDRVKEKGDPAPRWTLEPMAGGRTRVVILAVRKAHPILLKRGGHGVSVLRLLPQSDPSGEMLAWRCEVPLGPGEALDLYLLDQEVADPATLPETGPVAGFRARIHPRP